MTAQPLRVLLVEDSAPDAELEIGALAAEGYECAVTLVKSEAELIAALERDSFDLAVSDHTMPGFDGLVALRIVHERFPELPFIFVSGTLGEERAVESLKLGATDYVLKDRMNRLGPAVRRALAEAAARRQRLQLEDQLRQSQKMEALGQFTGGIAHDFNNILTVILSGAEMLGDGLRQDQAELRADLDAITNAAQRGSEMIRKLLAFSRREELTLRSLDLAVAVREVVGTLRRMVPETIVVEVATEPDLPRILADRGAIEQMVMNLATNARDAMPAGGSLAIAVRRAELRDGVEAVGSGAAPGPYVCLAVTDTGTGMDELTRRRVFEPLFTTKPKDKGTGLGMAMVFGLMQQHGGRIELRSAPGQGTTISLHFPADPVA